MEHTAMKYRLLIPLILAFSSTQGFTARNQGFFDLGFGSSFVDDVTMNKTTTEYYPGAAIQTSVGIAYRNGLGLSLQYGFNFNQIKTEDTPKDTATELLNSIVLLNFTYTVLPSSEVTFFFNGGPGLVINSDQKLRSTATEEPSSTVTTAAADGSVTETVTTVNNDQAADPYESYDNINFGYQFGGGIEYRKNKHQSVIIQLGYLNTNIYNSNFNTETEKVSSWYVDELESYIGNITLRYYL